MIRIFPIVSQRSLLVLQQFCAVMIRQIDLWLKTLNIQGEHQERIVELWESIRQKIKNLKEKKVSMSVIQIHYEKYI